MTAPNESPFSLNPAYRPSVDDFNGCALVNDPEDPPPDTYPTAELFNTMGKTIVSLGKTAPSAKISVRNNGAVVVLFFSSASEELSDTDFIFTHSATGDVSITWPAGALPPPMANPEATLNVVFTVGHTYAIGVTAIANGVRVTTVKDAALADLDFTVTIN